MSKRSALKRRNLIQLLAAVMVSGTSCITAVGAAETSTASPNKASQGTNSTAPSEPLSFIDRAHPDYDANSYEGASGSASSDGAYGCDYSGCDALLPGAGFRTCGADSWGERLWSATTLEGDAALFYQGVTSGGLDRDFNLGGHNDYVANIDFGKMGVSQGTFLKVRAEHRYGETINGDTGAFLPAAILPDLPVRDSEDIYITNFLVTQMLSPRFAVFAGKLDTLDGDYNAFAHGRGKTQFFNTAFVANPIALRTVPYSTLGAGFAYLGNDGIPLLSFSVLNGVDTTRTVGISDLFDEGVALVGEIRLPTHYFGRPGHSLLGATWNSRDYVSLGQDPRVVFPDVAIAQTEGSWSVYWNFDHYLVTDPCNASRGWGVFGRSGVADDDVNPINYFVSYGIGGHNPLRRHSNDTFGVGWYYAETSDEIGPIIQAAVGPVGSGNGVEMFYNWAATSWLNITPDLQIIDPARKDLDTAVVVGMRAVANF